MSAYRWMWIVPVLFIIAAPVSAQDVGTAAEAKTMLEKVVTDRKAKSPSGKELSLWNRL